MHADFGLGSFMGVDGATHTPGNLYGHVTMDPMALTIGDHEFEVLGFEDCCDGHQELEVHLPCDNEASAWRVVTAGENDCLKCSTGAAATTCSSQTSSAGDCANGICTGGNFWGDSAATFNLRICIDQQDDIFYQDDRLWISYGGMYSAAGAHGSCPKEYQGTAYVDDQPWDISALSECRSGATCQVSTSYTSPTFSVPTGCAAVHSQVVKNDGRGFAMTGTGGYGSTVDPTPGNGWRGELELFDDPAGADVYDVTVTLTCAGTADPPTVRLGCAHNVGTGSCHQGRIEVLHPTTNVWGEVCGHWFWDNDNGAAIVCKQLGYVGGSAYTFGVSPSLPELPIVWGMHVCDSDDFDSIFDCPANDGTADPSQFGANYDWSAQNCNHAIAQGAICYDNARPSQVKADIETCRHIGDMTIGHDIATGAEVTTGYQAVAFGCIEFYSTQCVYDISNMAGSGAQGGAFSRAMRAFSACADRSPQPVGYCHGSLANAGQLSNQAVCIDGAQLNIGFHIRIPFRVLQAGTFTFRQHADYGLGSFIGVDGAEHTPGNAWGHLQLAPATLTLGDHEYEALGFEDCCDGHQELEVHLNCDTAAAPWRIVTSGQSDCMSCQHTSTAAACSAAVAGGDAGEAAHCGGTGGSVVCSSSAGGCGEANSYFDGEFSHAAAVFFLLVIWF